MLKAAVISAMYLTSAVAFAQDPYANAPAYVKTVAGGGVKVIQPLVTTGQQVPLAGSTSQKYLFMNFAPHRAYRLARFPVAHAFPNLALVIR